LYIWIGDISSPIFSRRKGQPPDDLHAIVLEDLLLVRRFRKFIGQVLTCEMESV
jgi:hypothetical protein